MKMEETECSETSAYKIQTSGIYPEESIQQIQDWIAKIGFPRVDFLTIEDRTDSLSRNVCKELSPYDA